MKRTLLLAAIAVSFLFCGNAMAQTAFKRNNNNTIRTTKGNKLQVHNRGKMLMKYRKATKRFMSLRVRYNRQQQRIRTLKLQLRLAQKRAVQLRAKLRRAQIYRKRLHRLIPPKR